MSIFSNAVIAVAFALSAASGAAQDAGGAAAGRQDKPRAEAVGAGKANAKAEKKTGTDCSPQRAGVRCSRPKPRKPWFFGG